ncbi:MAG TPA: NDP-sugar synthase [bacterium]|nr:NDP-sugar synthase [bacterium]
MKAMLFCAGVGSRLLPITETVPKPMVDFFGKPLVDYTLSQLADWGIDEIVVNLFHRPMTIKRHILSRWRSKFGLHFSKEQELLGTGGGLKRAERLLGDETFLAVNSDFVLDPSIDMEHVVQMHSKRAAAATLLLAQRKSQKYTPIQTDAEGRISMLGGLFGTADGERPSYVFCGLHILEAAIFEYLCSGRPDTVMSANVKMLRTGLLVQGFVHNGYWQELGDKEGYLQAHFDVLDGSSPLRRAVEMAGNYAIIKHNDQAETMEKLGIDVSSGAKIEPPVALGASCSIGKGASVGPYVIVGEGASVGRGAKITRSVVWRGAKIAPDAVLANEIVPS